ncbi:hypothetical protein U1Q18_025642 [Sarracenia purpurea var. burkii]
MPTSLKPGGILKSGNSNFVPDLGKEENAGYVAVSEIQGLAVPLSKTQVGAPRPPTGLAPRPSVAQGELNRSWAKVITFSRGPNLDGGFQRLNQRSSSVDWVRVRKKRNGKKIRVQEERKPHLGPMFEVSREKKNSKLDVPPVGKPANLGWAFVLFSLAMLLYIAFAGSVLYSDCWCMVLAWVFPTAWCMCGSGVSYLFLHECGWDPPPFWPFGVKGGRDPTLYKWSGFDAHLLLVLMFFSCYYWSVSLSVVVST